MKSAEASYSIQPRAEMTPEDVFEHRWAMTVLSRALSRLQQESKLSGTESQFEQLKSYLTSGESQVSYKEAAGILNMSEGAVKVAVHRLRKRFGQCLRAELAETVADLAEVDTELRHMLSTLSS